MAEQTDNTAADHTGVSDGEKPAADAKPKDEGVKSFLEKTWGSHWSHHAQITPDAARAADKKAARKRKRR